MVSTEIMKTEDFLEKASMRWDWQGRGTWVCVRDTLGRSAIGIGCVSSEKSLTCGNI